MKNWFCVGKHFCASIVLFVLGVGCIVYGDNPCYKSTLADAAKSGCQLTGTVIGPGGNPCTSVHHTAPGSCSYDIKSRTIRIGASGGQGSGFSSFVIESDVCYSYVGCEPSLPYLWGDTFVWDCVQVRVSPMMSNGSWSAQHASGDVCPATGG
jgi:hypothetical protein